VRNLEEGTRYYFSATAYNTSGNESDYCNEVAAFARRTITEPDFPPRRLWLGRQQ
jgi:thymidylate kinase